MPSVNYFGALEVLDAACGMLWRQAGLRRPW